MFLGYTIFGVHNFWGTQWESLRIIHALSPFPGRLKGKFGIKSFETIRTCASNAIRCNRALHAVRDLHHFVSIGQVLTQRLRSRSCNQQPERKTVVGQHFSISRYHLKNVPANSAM